MKAGLLRHRLAIQVATETRTDSGQIAQSWTTLTTVWGSIEPMKGAELYQAQQMCPRVTHKITIRGRANLTTVSGSHKLSSAHRIFYNARFLSIDYAMDVQERGIQTIAYATEIPVPL